MLIFLGNIRLIIFGSIMFILSLESNATTFWESHAHNFQSQWDFEKIEDRRLEDAYSLERGRHDAPSSFPNARSLLHFSKC